MRRISGIERRHVRAVLRTEFRSSRFVGMLARAEEAFAQEVSARFAIGCVNGTATLHLALEALGIGPGDEVIVPSLTMSATCFSVLHAGATPVFADVDAKTWQIDPQSVRTKITTKTKAIMTVALYGGSPNYEQILEAADGIPLVEDNAESIGSTFKGKPLGSFGAFSSYSFQSSKHLTAGEGGMLCTNSPELAENARVLQTLGYAAVRQKETRKIPKSVIQNPSYLRHERLGWNYRMSELTAAVILGQTERAARLVKVRLAAADAIADELKEVSWLTPQESYPDSTSSYWAKAYRLNTSVCSWQDFYSIFLSYGGRGVYSAWALGYMEPAFQQLSLQGREKHLTRSPEELFSAGTSPVAEGLQAEILAFRTNEWSKLGLRKQMRALRKTVREINLRIGLPSEN